MTQPSQIYFSLVMFRLTVPYFHVSLYKEFNLIFMQILKTVHLIFLGHFSVANSLNRFWHRNTFKKYAFEFNKIYIVHISRLSVMDTMENVNALINVDET